MTFLYRFFLSLERLFYCPIREHLHKWFISPLLLLWNELLLLVFLVTLPLFRLLTPLTSSLLFVSTCPRDPTLSFITDYVRTCFVRCLPLRCLSVLPGEGIPRQIVLIVCNTNHPKSWEKRWKYWLLTFPQTGPLDTPLLDSKTLDLRQFSLFSYQTVRIVGYIQFQLYIFFMLTTDSWQFKNRNGFFSCSISEPIQPIQCRSAEGCRRIIVLKKKNGWTGETVLLLPLL